MRRIKQLTEVVALLAAIASIAGLLFFYLNQVGESNVKLTISAITLFVTFLVGLWSKYFADIGRRFTTTPRVFVSYARERSDLAERISEQLSAAGFHVWLDQKRILAGDNFQQKIDEAIEDTDIVVAVLSKERSKWAEYELDLAQRSDKTVIPVISDDIEVPSSLTSIRYVDLRQDEDSGIRELVGTIKERA